MGKKETEKNWEVESRGEEKGKGVRLSEDQMRGDETR